MDDIDDLFDDDANETPTGIKLSDIPTETERVAIIHKICGLREFEFISNREIAKITDMSVYACRR